MILRIKFLFVVLLWCSKIQAQVTKETFNKAIDLLNCKTVELSIQKENSFNEFKNACPCGHANYNQISQFLESRKLSRTFDLAEEIESLKGVFNPNMTAKKAIIFLSETIFIEQKKYQKIFAFATTRKGTSEYADYLDNLKKGLTQIFTDNTAIEQEQPNEKTTPIASPVIEKEPQSDLESKINAIKSTINSQDKSFLGAYADYLILLSMLLALLALFLSFGKRNINDIYHALIPKLLDSNRLQEYLRSQTGPREPMRSNRDSVEITDANNRIRGLEGEIEKIKAQLKPASPISNFNLREVYEDVKQPEAKTEVFFLSTPNSDGSFNESSALPIPNDAATIYRFNKIGNNRANFLINDKDTSIRLALQYPDKNIDPVCDAVNAFNPKASRIETVEQGEAELQGTKWLVNKKAKIRYEN